MRTPGRPQQAERRWRMRSRAWSAGPLLAIAAPLLIGATSAAASSPLALPLQIINLDPLPLGILDTPTPGGAGSGPGPALPVPTPSPLPTISVPGILDATPTPGTTPSANPHPSSTPRHGPSSAPTPAPPVTFGGVTGPGAALIDAQGQAPGGEPDIVSVATTDVAAPSQLSQTLSLAITEGLTLSSDHIWPWLAAIWFFILLAAAGLTASTRLRHKPKS